MWLECEGAVALTNSGKSTAYDVNVEALDMGAFDIYFSPDRLAIGVGIPGELNATLKPCEGFKFNDSDIDTTENPLSLLGSLVYQTGQVAQEKRIKISGHLDLKVTWRDSNNNYFSSTLEDGKPSPIRREPTPMSEEEKTEVYEQVED